MPAAVPVSQTMYKKDEKVLCFHHELLYEAKILDSKLSDPADKNSYVLYKVHYKGWKATWDDWVPGDRIRKNNEDNRDLAQTLRREADASRNPPAPAKSTTKRKGGSDGGSNLDDEHSTSRGVKRMRDYDIDRHDVFLNRPEVRIPIPDLLKSILVDDWEFVTKNQTLVKLPSKRPVNVILQDYFDQEKTKRRLGSAEADLLEEVVQGVKDYFKKALGRILLYSFEREQYQEIRKLYENAPEGSEWANKDAGDVYGAEHLCRLFVKMPEMIAQTNMDVQTVNRLREEIAKMVLWMAKNVPALFVMGYEAPPPEYVERAKGA